MHTAKTTRLFIATAICALIILLTAIVIASGPMPQDNAYHQLADRRTWLGIPNFFDIASNLPFAIIGLLGLSLALKQQARPFILSWSVFFAGLILVAAGSSYYHWQPNNATLMWDRLPMTICFMALFSALLTEYVFPRLETVTLPCALILGLSSVLYWRHSNDLRFYALIQFGALSAIPFFVWLGKARYTHRHYLIYGLLFYFLAKIFEITDKEIFRLTGEFVSGHTLKHLAAATATYCVYRMLKRRTPL